MAEIAPAFGRHVERPRADLVRCTNSATAGDAATDSGETPSDSEGATPGSEKFVFGREPQRRTARHDDSQQGAALRQRRHFGCDSDDLLEVVQKQQGGPVADQGDDAVEERSFLRLLDVECSRERRKERCRLGDVCERDEREGVGELCCEEPSELDQHARLSDPAGTGDRDRMLTRTDREGGSSPVPPTSGFAESGTSPTCGARSLESRVSTDRWRTANSSKGRPTFLS